ncbi:MAG: hypothetical protein ABIL68_11035 [bacterium]
MKHSLRVKHCSAAAIIVLTCAISGHTSQERLTYVGINISVPKKIEPFLKEDTDRKSIQKSLPSSQQTIVALNDGFLENMINPQEFDIDGNGIVDPNGATDYFLVLFEPSDIAAYGLQFPLKITGVRFYNNCSTTVWPEILVCPATGTRQSFTINPSNFFIKALKSQDPRSVIPS